MITCKEDLVNTYIENDNGVLRDVYVSLMKLHSVHSCGEKDFGYILDKPCFGCYQWDHTGGLQAEWNQQCPLEDCKQLTLADLLPTSYENTKVYSLDEDVIRKYAELCGVEYNHRHTDDEEVGICKVNNQGFVDTFIVGSVVDIEVEYTTTTLTTEQILAAWDLRFNSEIDSASIKDTQAGMVKDKPKDGELWLCSFKDSITTPPIAVEWHAYMSDSHKAIEKLRTESEYQAVVKERDELLKICTRHDEEIESPKLPRTKVEYVKCDIKDAVVLFLETNAELYAEPDENQKYDGLQDFINNMDECGSGSLYRRTEVEIDILDAVAEWGHKNKIGIFSPQEFKFYHLLETNKSKAIENVRF